MEDFSSKAKLCKYVESHKYETFKHVLIFDLSEL